eukprot:m.186005 g.186005  ORF g.186005 m.186005 type:complete len:122 (-) comp53549_c0_seq24:710-1075(-)
MTAVRGRCVYDPASWPDAVDIVPPCVAAKRIKESRGSDTALQESGIYLALHIRICTSSEEKLQDTQMALIRGKMEASLPILASGVHIHALSQKHLTISQATIPGGNKHMRFPIIDDGALPE